MTDDKPMTDYPVGTVARAHYADGSGSEMAIRTTVGWYGERGPIKPSGEASFRFEVIDLEHRISPTHALGETWKPGERVEAVSGGYGGNPTKLRPGTVERIDRIYGFRESLVVRFDDGETRAINPDVMRHRREEATT